MNILINYSGFYLLSNSQSNVVNTPSEIKILKGLKNVNNISEGTYSIFYNNFDINKISFTLDMKVIVGNPLYYYLFKGVVDSIFLIKTPYGDWNNSINVFSGNITSCELNGDVIELVASV